MDDLFWNKDCSEDSNADLSLRANLTLKHIKLVVSI